MDVTKLFKGIAVIIDDEINDQKSSIAKIKKMIEEKKIPVITYSELPEEAIIPSLVSASFVILDWDYSKALKTESSEERVILPESLSDDLISFIKHLMDESFMPIFLFTSKPLDDIKLVLEEKGLWNRDKTNRVFIQAKEGITNEEELFGKIENWLKEMPSVYVLKEWDDVISKTKTKMFQEFFEYSPNWTRIILKLLKNDNPDEYVLDFGNFITRQMTNRIGRYDFDESIIGNEEGIEKDQLLKVIEGERYVEYSTSNCPNQANTGDLFYCEGNYYINIRAQCDLARNGNPKLYLLKGESMKFVDISIGRIKITEEKKLMLDQRKGYALDELNQISDNKDRRKEFNDNNAQYRNEAFFASGNIIGKKNSYYIACIAGKEVIRFDLDINRIESFSEFKENRIGRVLPPYITIIQQCCSNYIVREGSMPTPRQVFL